MKDPDDNTEWDDASDRPRQPEEPWQAGQSGQPNPEQLAEFQQFMRRFFEEGGEISPEDFAKAGIPGSPEQLTAALQQMREVLGAMSSADAGPINWPFAIKQAKSIAGAENSQVAPEATKALSDAQQLASIWLTDRVALADVGEVGVTLSPQTWVVQAVSVYQSLSEPLAARLAGALSENLSNLLPAEMAGLAGEAGRLLRAMGGTMFGMQLGQVMGQLANQVMTGHELGLPIFSPSRPSYVLQNLERFSSEMSQDRAEVFTYFAVREIAFTRLFRSAKWLPGALESQISAYASGLTINSEAIVDLGSQFDPNNLDPTNTEELRIAIESGRLLVEPTEEQRQALRRIEDLLALIEGWAEVVTESSCQLLPNLSAISEAVRRRRATGSPPSKSFGAIIGVELTPRRLREAIALWREVTQKFGVEKRDELWSHPDQAISSEELSDPSLLLARLAGSEPDEMDKALRDMLGD